MSRRKTKPLVSTVAATILIACCAGQVDAHSSTGLRGPVSHTHQDQPEFAPTPSPLDPQFYNWRSEQDDDDPDPGDGYFPFVNHTHQDELPEIPPAPPPAWDLNPPDARSPFDINFGGGSGSTTGSGHTVQESIFGQPSLDALFLEDPFGANMIGTPVNAAAAFDTLVTPDDFDFNSHHLDVVEPIGQPNAIPSPGALPLLLLAGFARRRRRH